MQGTKPFIDCSILSYRDRSKDSIFYLEELSQIFTRMMPMNKRSFKDETGRLHIRLECKDNQQFEAVFKKWCLHFEKLLDSLPKTMKRPLTKSLTKKDAPSVKNEAYLVIKIQTNHGILPNYPTNLANAIYPLMGLQVFYETVLDGFIAYIQEESDFNTILTSLWDEKRVREYCEKLAIKSEEHITQSGKILKNAV